MEPMTNLALSYGYSLVGVPNYTTTAPSLGNDGTVTRVDQAVMKAATALVSPSALNKTGYTTTQDAYNLGLMMPVSP